MPSSLLQQKFGSSKPPQQHQSQSHLMSAILIDFVEARSDPMKGVRSGMEVRVPAPPPITPQSSGRSSCRKRRKHPRRNFKITDSLHESFGWLEEYVDVKYEEMMKRNSASLSSQSLESALSSSASCDCLELKGSTSEDKGHRRTHSRRESILIGLDQGDLQAIFEAAVAA
jgi:hypothetical protein